MTDTEILDWLEKNMAEFIPIPPQSSVIGSEDWSIYEAGHVFMGRGPTLRKTVENCVEMIEFYKKHPPREE